MPIENHAPVERCVESILRWPEGRADGLPRFNKTALRAAAFFTIARLVASARVGNAHRIWEDTASLVAQELDQPGFAFIASVANHVNMGQGEVKAAYSAVKQSIQRLLDDGTIVLERGESMYPPLLAEVKDAPEFLFVVGDVGLLHRPMIAVVGTRKPGKEGILRAKKLGYLLSKRGIVVASGLALGIDEAAHIGALTGGGKTIAVLGTPIGKVYPREHADLQRVIAETGALVSQFDPGVAVQRFFFPLRNAVMSGLCLGTVVVEASETSGALIQARKCLEQGRKLFIPQSVVNRDDLQWPRKFAQRGALVFSDIGDLLAVLEKEGLVPREDNKPEPPKPLSLNTMAVVHVR